MASLRIDPALVPPRLVLSRKGSDAAWGGRPSLRLGDELISLPIPEGVRRSRLGSGDGLRYGDLPRHPRVGALHAHLKNTSAHDLVHLDPDLRPELRSRLDPGLRPGLEPGLEPGLRPQAQLSSLRTPGLFGQVGAAARHLDNQGVGPGTLFLFFGWFREIVEEEGRWRRVGRHEQILWGWLQVESVHPVKTPEHAAALPWAGQHPHVAHWQRYDQHNRLYRSAAQLSFAPALPGAGVFRYKPALSLTRMRPDVHASAMVLAFLFRSAGLTYNQNIGAGAGSLTSCRASRLHLDSAPIGQEFVSPVARAFRGRERAAVARWLEDLFEGV